MTTADHIAALAERAQAAVASIRPDPIAWAESHGLRVNLNLSTFNLTLNLHGLEMTQANAVALLRETFPTAEVKRNNYGTSHWADAKLTSEGMEVMISLFAHGDDA